MTRPITPASTRSWFRPRCMWFTPMARSIALKGFLRISSSAASRALILTAASLAHGFITASSASAQDRLVGMGALAIGGTVDMVGFGGFGYQQPGVMGLDSVQLRRIEQFSVPISLALPIGTAWTIDLQSAFTSSRLTWKPRSGAGGEEAEVTSSLSGPTDVRIRATGRLFNDVLVLTTGVNVPTGKTGLSASDLTLLRAIAAPALALGAPPVGIGPGGTAGVVLTQEVDGWAVAVGGSYELRGKYQPIAALTAGSPSTNFKPGSVIRGSLGIDGLAGMNRLSVTTAIDFYSDDELRNPSLPSSAPPLATVRLGPIMTTDAQIQFAAPRVRELVLWGVNRYRTGYKRDGVEVAGTSGNYFDGGLRTSIPVSAVTDILVTADARLHSGLAIDQGLAASGVTSVGSTIGLTRRVGSVTWQPYLRIQGGRLHSAASGGRSASSFFGGSAGVIFMSRF